MKLAADNMLRSKLPLRRHFYPFDLSNFRRRLTSSSSTSLLLWCDKQLLSLDDSSGVTLHHSLSSSRRVAAVTDCGAKCVSDHTAGSDVVSESSSCVESFSIVGDDIRNRNHAGLFSTLQPPALSESDVTTQRSRCSFIDTLDCSSSEQADFSPSIYLDSATDLFSERSVRDSSPSLTYSYLLQYRLAFQRSPASPAAEDVQSHHEPTEWLGLINHNGEEDEECYLRLRSRERRQAYTQHSHSLIRQRLQIVHWIIQQSHNKAHQKETMFLGVYLRDRFISNGNFKKKRNGNLKKRDYLSSQKILLVGEGDFSFSASIARGFDSATNIIATSLDSEEYLKLNYTRAMENISDLRRRGARVLHEVDATTVANHTAITGQSFDRVIYNFPHCDDFTSTKLALRKNQTLVSLFMKNASELIEQDGEIHIRHKTSDNFLRWDLMGLASEAGLVLIKKDSVKFHEFEGYESKYGYEGAKFRSDHNFNCRPCATYKFGLPWHPKMPCTK